MHHHQDQPGPVKPNFLFAEKVLLRWCCQGITVITAGQGNNEKMKKGVLKVKPTQYGDALVLCTLSQNYPLTRDFEDRTLEKWCKESKERKQG